MFKQIPLLYLDELLPYKRIRRVWLGLVLHHLQSRLPLQYGLQTVVGYLYNLTRHTTHSGVVHLFVVKDFLVAEAKVLPNQVELK